jgi:CheY-like chemotaxis protein
MKGNIFYKSKQGFGSLFMVKIPLNLGATASRISFIVDDEAIYKDLSLTKAPSAIVTKVMYYGSPENHEYFMKTIQRDELLLECNPNMNNPQKVRETVISYDLIIIDLRYFFLAQVLELANLTMPKTSERLDSGPGGPGSQKDMPLRMIVVNNPPLSSFRAEDEEYTFGRFKHLKICRTYDKAIEEVLECHQKKLKAFRNHVGVLIVDDDVFNLKIMSTFLKQDGYQTYTAKNGEEGYDAFVENYSKIKFLLIDDEMPFCDGLTCTKFIKKFWKELYPKASDDKESSSGTEEHLVIIGLTTDADEVRKQKCIKAGMEIVLQKPLKMGNLLALISKIALSQKSAAAVVAAMAAGQL